MSKIAKAAVGLMIATIVSKILGFGREQVLAAAYGATTYSDVYITALNIPTVIFAAIGSAIATTFIPLYYEAKNTGGDKRAIDFTNNVISIVTIICTILAILGCIFTEPLVKSFAVGFKGETLSLAIEFTRIMMIGIVFIGLSNIMTPFLQMYNNFTVPGLIGIPYNIIIILSIILSLKYNSYILAYGTLIAMLSQFLFQLPFAIKNGYKFRMYLNFKDEYIKKMIWLVGPVFIGVAVNQINAMVDRTLASTLAQGSISALNYANRLNGFVMGLFIASVGAVIYPMLSKLSDSDEKEKFSDTIVKSVNSVVLMVLPISVGAIVLAKPIVRILFERGEFDERATSMTAIALVFYSIGMLGFGLRDIVGKVFYSLKDTKTPMINGAISMGLNIVLNLILVKFMGHAGLAFATSIAAIVSTLLLFIQLQKHIGYYGQDKIIKGAIKSLIASISMGFGAVFSYKTAMNILGNTFLNECISLFIGVFIGATIYAILMILLKVDEIKIFTDMIKNKIIKK